MKRLMAQGLAGSVGLVAVGTVAFVALADVVTAIFATDRPIVLSRATILLFGLACLVRAWNDVHVMALLSVSRLRPFWVVLPLHAAVAIVAQYALSRFWGLDGIVVGLLASLVVPAGLLPHFFRPECAPRAAP